LSTRNISQEKTEMRVKSLAIGITALLPVVVIAAGSHSDPHHDHATPAAEQHGGDRHDKGHTAIGHASAVGGPAEASAAGRTINVGLLDTMRFAFDAPLALKRGEVVRFVVTNRGQMRHEFSIGSEAEQDSHRAMMRSMPNMVHQDPNAVTVEPGETKELVWRFDGDQPVVIACNIPGHAEAGMILTVDVGS
jgi:uncharacterized cupredoxin-like copper-binding protein